MCATGSPVQLQHRLCLPLLPRGCVYRHCLSDQLLFLLSKTNIRICIYIFLDRVSWNSGKNSICLNIYVDILKVFNLQIVLSLVRQFGAFVAVTVTTFRKAISIVLSFVFFAKPFTYHYIYSGLLVLLGIYINLYAKNKDSSLVLTFNRIFYKVRRLLFVPKFHTEKSSTYNI